MRVVSLFSGIGGIDLALERCGYSVVLQVENDKAATKILERHWPNVPRQSDIQEADYSSVPDPLTLVAGGDPCQCRSAAASGRSQAPDLSGHFLLAVYALRPVWVFRENVRAGDVVDFAAGLELLGYSSLVVELCASHFTGQSRMRQYCLGLPPAAVGGVLSALHLAQVGPVAGQQGDSEKQRAAGDLRAGGDPRAMRCVRGRTDPGPELGVVAEAVKCVRSHHNSQTTESTLVAESMRMVNSGGIGRETGVVAERSRDCGQAVTGKYDRGDAARVCEPIPTVISSGTNSGSQPLRLAETDAGRDGGGWGLRVLDPVECERLQGLPDGWTAGQSRTARQRQIGNSVCVPAVEWVVRAVTEVLEMPGEGR